MAHWHRKRKNHVYVYTWDREQSKQVSLPRSYTKHLDNQTDSYIDSWVSDWALKHEHKKIQLQHLRMAGSIADQYLNQYCDYLAAEGELTPKTIAQDHKQKLDKYVLPFFASQGCEHPNEWPEASIRMRDWLRDQGVTEGVIYRCNIAVKGFWKWLGEEKKTSSGYDLNLRTPKSSQRKSSKTPLKVLVKPEQVYKLYRDFRIPFTLRFYALVGYFFSLRPQEIFAVAPETFIAGNNRILKYELVQSFRKLDLDTRLVANVMTHRTETGSVEPCPEKKSGGVVPCWDKQGEELLFDALEKFYGGKFEHYRTNDKGYAMWKKYVYPILGCTMKDMRRASIYHIGHHTSLATVITVVKDYARHSSLVTTELYLRSPDEETEPNTNLSNPLDREA